MKIFSLRRAAAAALSLTLAFASVTATNASVATGGNCAANVDSNVNVVVQESGSRCYIAFKGTQTYQWTPPSTVSSIQLLVVAGGGGGGMKHAAGGGAGGLIQSTNFAITSAAISVTVGAGGAGATNINTTGSNGNNSVVSGTGITTKTAVGGGGGNSASALSGQSGGSSGGSWPNASFAAGGLQTGTLAAATAGQGFSGSFGNFRDSVAPTFWVGGAGGGAGGAASPGSQELARAGVGGDGLEISWIPTTLGLGQISGSSVYFAGGGGGGSTTNSVGGSGGIGGGGTGGTGAGAVGSGTANTGGGGGGGGLNGSMPNGGSGGSGIVVVSYAVADALNTVTFKANNGAAVADTTQSINTDIATNLSANPFTKTGYNFNGWNSAALGGGTSYTAAQSVTISSGLTLYAQWAPGTNTVTFKANDGGSTADTTQSITTDQATNLSANTFSRTGYAFSGWNTAALGVGTSYSAAQSVTINSGLTLYAQWTPGTNTVTFKANDGASTADATQSITTDVATALRANSFTRAGYSFNGWDTVALGGGTHYNAAQSVTINSALTVFAQWSPTTQSITYDSNGADTGSASRTLDSYTTGGSAITLPTVGSMVKAGYQFAGWSSTAGGAAISGTYTTLTNSTLFAKWTPTTQTIAYDPNGATGSAARTSDSYTTGGTAVTLPGVGTMVKTGYSLRGWATTANGTVISGTYTTLTNTTLYAIWGPAIYAVTFDSNHATGGSPSFSSTNFTTGDTTVILAEQGTLTRVGYSFDGWSSVANDSNTKILRTINYLVPADTTLYALWVPTTQSITYNVNGATGAPDRSSDAYTTDSTAVTLPGVGTMSKPGFVFAGWTTVADSASAKISNPTNYAPLETVTLYALWTAQSNSGSTSSGSTHSGGSATQSGNEEESSIDSDGTDDAGTSPEGEESSTGEETQKPEEKSNIGTDSSSTAGQLLESPWILATGGSVALALVLLLVISRKSRRKH